MPSTVDNICNALHQNALMTEDEVGVIRKRWFRPNREGEQDPERFAKWLVINQFVSELQANFVYRGEASQLFLNQYKLLDRLAKGRLAGVYRAADPQGQVFAIKILPAAKAKAPEVFARFQREAEMSLRLNHPNLVRTFESGESNGRHYIVMEYLEGSSLEEVVQRRGKLAPLEAARIIGHALVGLQHLHEQGMIHRNINPSNIMLATTPVPGKAASNQRVVKILDLGLGKELFDDDSNAPIQQGLTMEGDLLGSLEYMAPEQARNPSGVDIRADIYGLGCVLYFALAGQSPFPHSNILQRRSQNARPLSDFVPDMPEALQQIVDLMMSFDPAQRYQTPGAAFRAIRVFLASEEHAVAQPETVSPFQFSTSQETKEAEQPNDIVLLPVQPAPQSGRSRRSRYEPETSKVEQLWDILQPKDRELIFLGIGIAVVVLLECLVSILIGAGVREFVFLASGVVVGVAVDRYRHR